MDSYDLVVVGGGIVGLATAYRFGKRYPDKSIAILEKESQVARHQTGHNSGVLHSGIYYKPGSLKASNCRAGKLAMEEFCAREGIAHEVCGKVIVALDDDELPALQKIFQRGQANGVRCELVDRERLRELEPAAAGIRAIHVPEAGIVNYAQVCTRLAEMISAAGGQLLLDTRVTGIQAQSGSVHITTSRGHYVSKQLVNCGGLQCDRVAKLSGRRCSTKIVPFRGEYYQLKLEAARLVNNLIYPVPNPAFPFLGVHFTRMIDGTVECGPNAVLAFAREGYTKTTINPYDLVESLTYPGFLRMAVKYWREGAGEIWRSVSKAAFVRALQRLVPEIQSEDLEPAPAGVRAQAVARDGEMLDDFQIQQTDSSVVHVLNAPSPAATASLNIAKHIVDQL
jgi:L-2-hydroxyglutarate oxidase